MPDTSYAATVAPILKEAGEELQEHFGNVSFKKKSNDAADVVTELDAKIEHFVFGKLKEAYPSIGFVGEEYGTHAEGETYWLADPIDGTAHFIRGIPFCTTMLALISGDSVVFSAIYDFVRGDLYLAEKGNGATRNGEKISVSSRTLKEAYLALETDLANPVCLETYVDLFGKAAIVKTISAGYEFALIAAGKLDGRICKKPFGKDYDFAPGALLVAEAGGVVRNIGKEGYDFRDYDFVALNPTVYEELSHQDIPLWRPWRP